MPEYRIGHVKREKFTGSLALRTVMPESDPVLAERAWLISTPNQGARTAATAEVADWEDLYVPPGPED